MERYVCIHGHFYQPPRENPWLEEVELQETAYPFHDWNMRINEECYKQNAASRILGPDRKIIDIVNNYSNMSFNFGPTLLSWLETHEPDVYKSILKADKLSMEKFSGHGAAIAQVYNHMIMPLSNTRDKHTQVIWGIEDFESRFKRKPEGMWLAETAVNTDSLEVLAEHGIKFTILAPHQALKFRKIGVGRWVDVKNDNLDITMPYLCHLPSGKTINLFFYNGKVSNGVAYGGLLHDGKGFADKLIGGFNNNKHEPQLMHIATDGESFGHHHRHGDMALAYCLHYIKTNNLAKITVYSEYLEKFPPTHEVQISENTSWSCCHGVERWKSNCGCSGKKELSGKQQWREPLRNSLDWLRDRLAENFEQNFSQYSNDPWKVRNEYIKVINDRSENNVNDFIQRVTNKSDSEQNTELELADKIKFFKLLETQRMAMLMYTSCGWFFDNLTGIETLQVLQYAARAMQLYHELTGADLLDKFKEIIIKAPVNLIDVTNGREVYEQYVEPTRIDLNRVGAHIALSSIFMDPLEEQQEIYCYTIKIKDFKDARAGFQKLATGRISIKSNIILEEHSVDFATLHLGAHNLFTAIETTRNEQEFQQIRNELETALYNGQTNTVMREINTKFSRHSYTIWHLFRDEQRSLVYDLLKGTWDNAETSFRHIYEDNYSIMLMLRNMNMNLPKVLAAPAEFIINQDLCREIQDDDMNIDRLKELTDEAARLDLQLDIETIHFEASAKINNLMETFETANIDWTSDDIELLSTIESALKILKGIVPDMDLQLAQNILFRISKEKYPQMKQKAAEQNEDAIEWIRLFELVAEHLGIVI